MHSYRQIYAFLDATFFPEEIRWGIIEQKQVHAWYVITFNLPKEKNGFFPNGRVTGGQSNFRKGPTGPLVNVATAFLPFHNFHTRSFQTKLHRLLTAITQQTATS